MKKRHGFTLIELLVVISIIALLLAILMPSLKRARDQASGVVCRSNLKQWNVILFMYTDDNKGSFPPGWNTEKGMWMSRMRNYYQDRDICLCPKATKLQSEGHPSGPFVGWGIYGDTGYYNGWIPSWGDEGDYGSYSMNGWMCNPPDEGLYVIPEKERPWFWRNVNIAEDLSNIPTFCDGIWDGTMARHNDKPPSYPGEKLGLEGMWNYCIPRHGSERTYYINCCFLDNSVQEVPLKSLWSLKWHKKFRTDIRPNWPDWLK